ncbi:MAG: hypothetical protein DMG07_24650 [Acidobacteria bacterium]|nr:MAG: hypothetical protein DMG07_24650 [Acidobacteriota bacterium]
MNSTILGHRRRILPALVLGALIAFGGALGLRAQDETKIPDAVREKISLAGGHHNLALLLAKKGDADSAAAEARKIIELRLPPEHELRVAKSMTIIAEKLGETRKFDVAQDLLDDALKSLVEGSKNRAMLLLAKARLYMQAGDDDKAIELYRKAFEPGGRR